MNCIECKKPRFISMTWKEDGKEVGVCNYCVRVVHCYHGCLNHVPCCCFDNGVTLP